VAKALALSPPTTDHYPSSWVGPANEAAAIAKQALEAYSGAEQEYRNSPDGDAAQSVVPRSRATGGGRWKRHAE